VVGSQKSGAGVSRMIFVAVAAMILPPRALDI
jgi:hypothetical protein